MKTSIYLMSALFAVPTLVVWGQECQESNNDLIGASVKTCSIADVEGDPCACVQKFAKINTLSPDEQSMANKVKEDYPNAVRDAVIDDFGKNMLSLGTDIAQLEGLYSIDDVAPDAGQTCSLDRIEQTMKSCPDRISNSMRDKLTKITVQTQNEVKAILGAPYTGERFRTQKSAVTCMSDRDMLVWNFKRLDSKLSGYAQQLQTLNPRVEAKLKELRKTEPAASYADALAALDIPETAEITRAMESHPVFRLLTEDSNSREHLFNSVSKSSNPLAAFQSDDVRKQVGKALVKKCKALYDSFKSVVCGKHDWSKASSYSYVSQRVIPRPNSTTDDETIRLKAHDQLMAFCSADHKKSKDVDELIGNLVRPLPASYRTGSLEFSTRNSLSVSERDGARVCQFFGNKTSAELESLIDQKQCRQNTDPKVEAYCGSLLAYADMIKQRESVSALAHSESSSSSNITHSSTGSTLANGSSNPGMSKLASKFLGKTAAPVNAGNGSSDVSHTQNGGNASGSDQNVNGDAGGNGSQVSTLNHVNAKNENQNQTKNGNVNWSDFNRRVANTVVSNSGSGNQGSIAPSDMTKVVKTMGDVMNQQGATYDKVTESLMNNNQALINENRRLNDQIARSNSNSGANGRTNKDVVNQKNVGSGNVNESNQGGEGQNGNGNSQTDVNSNSDVKNANVVSANGGNSASNSVNMKTYPHMDVVSKSNDNPSIAGKEINEIILKADIQKESEIALTDFSPAERTVLANEISKHRPFYISRFDGERKLQILVVPTANGFRFESPKEAELIPAHRVFLEKVKTLLSQAKPDGIQSAAK